MEILNNNNHFSSKVKSAIYSKKLLKLLEKHVGVVD